MVGEANYSPRPIMLSFYLSAIAMLLSSVQICNLLAIMLNIICPYITTAIMPQLIVTVYYFMATLV